MKYCHTKFFKITFLLVWALWPASQAFAQDNTVKIDPDVDTHLNSVKKLLVNPSEKNDLIAGYAFNDSLHRFLGQVSGTVLKSGTIQSISAVADDKSLTVNYALPIKSKWWTFQLTGAGAASKGVINVFTGDKFGKTLTFGATINKFLWGSAPFDGADAKKFKYFLKDADDRLDASLKKADKKNEQAIFWLVWFKFWNADFFKSPAIDMTNYTSHFKQARYLHTLLDKVKDFYPEDLDTTDYAKVGAFIDDLGKQRLKLIPYVHNVDELKVLDSLQTTAPFGHYRFMWASFTPKINQTDYPIFDPGNAGNLFTRTESDYFFSGAASVNVMWSFKKFKLLVYPGITVQNARLFDPKDSLGVSIHAPFTTGIDTVKSTGFYQSVANRKWVWGLNLPIMLYWTSGVGIDAGTGFKFNSGKNDFNVHAGVFFTLPAAGETITAEPLLRYDDDKSQTYARNFDKFSLGISLSLALPTFMKGSN